MCAPKCEHDCSARWAKAGKRWSIRPLVLQKPTTTAAPTGCCHTAAVAVDMICQGCADDVAMGADATVMITSQLLHPGPPRSLWQLGRNQHTDAVALPQGSKRWGMWETGSKSTQERVLLKMRKDSGGATSYPGNTHAVPSCSIVLALHGMTQSYCCPFVCHLPRVWCPQPPKACHPLPMSCSRLTSPASYSHSAVATSQS
mmetsp:Transcript_52279/g.87250  ORF Transcript_52279/g.87250 Transcript_52279/m.87250 type:complete len:201 (+) Transcript_52279:2253-2855(+)